MIERAAGSFTLALGVLCASTQAAPAAERMVAVVLISGDADGELAGRVEGQTSDLPLSILVERRAAAALGARPALGETAAIAGRSGARVIIWFERDASSWLVHIAEPEGDREFVRRVMARGDLASSATAEGVALVVRGALRALAAGGTIGVGEPAPAQPIAKLGFAGLGWRVVTAGGPDIHNGVTARAGLRLGRWHAGLSSAYFPAVVLDDGTTEIELERWSFFGGVGVDLGRDAGSDDTAWRVGFALEGGATRFERVTIQAGEPLQGTPPRATWSPTARGRARVARRVMGRIWLEFSLGADLLFRAPEFGVASGSESFDVHTRVRALEPFGVLGLLIDLG